MDIFKMLNHLVGVILFFWADPALPRKTVICMVNLLKKFIVEIFLPDLKVNILNSLDHPNPALKINQIFTRYEGIFDYVDSEKKMLKLLRSKGYIEHDMIKIATPLIEKTEGNVCKLVPYEISQAYLPLRKSLKFFLQLPGMFSKILDYMSLSQSDESGIINNIIQTHFWRDKFANITLSSSEILIPLFLYCDDFECGNALGTHAGVNKFCAIYAMIACLPPQISSRLSSILFSGLICAKDKKMCTNAEVFKALIEELNFLRRTGIKVSMNSSSYLVKFQLVMILGDNLGLNDIFDMTTSFKDTTFCRVCKAEPHQWKFMTKEDPKLFRTKKNYYEDILKDKPTETGLKKNSVFNNVDNFHVLDNISFDILHDALHGVCNYVLRGIIYNLIYKEGCITLEELNRSIQDFPFGKIASFNKPPEFQYNNLKNKINLKCSAGEMLTLMRFFGLIVGPFVKNRDDDNWRLFKYSRCILDIIMAPRVEPEYEETLNDFVHKHNLLYIALFGHLKPKFHFLIHYGRYLLVNGPLVHYWTMRFEGRHKELKSVATAISSTVNLLVSIAIKQTLKMFYMIHSFLVKNDPNSRSKIKDNVKYYDQIELHGSIYFPETVVVLDNTGFQCQFGEISKIFEENGEIMFILKKCTEIVFDEHVHAYIIEECDESISVKYTDLPKFPPCFHIKKDENYYVIPHYKI